MGKGETGARAAVVPSWLPVRDINIITISWRPGGAHLPALLPGTEELPVPGAGLLKCMFLMYLGHKSKVKFFNQVLTLLH